MDYQTLNDRLHGKGARSDCAMCGHNDWGGLGQADVAEVISLASPPPGGEYTAGHGHGAYGWACKNCGFIRLHAIVVLAPEQV